MSDAKKEEKKEEVPPAPSKMKSRILGIVWLVVVIGLSSVAGAALSPIIGPRVAGAPPPPKAAKAHAAPKEEADEQHEGGEAEEEEEEPEGEKGKKNEPKGLLTMDAVVVDLRDAANDTHHLKIGMAVELKKELPEEEGKIFALRAKDAEITYLRTLSYEEVTDHAKFEAIRKELTTRIVKAVGKHHGKKVLITEYVVQ